MHDQDGVNMSVTQLAGIQLHLQMCACKGLITVTSGEVFRILFCCFDSEIAGVSFERVTYLPGVTNKLSFMDCFQCSVILLMDDK